MPKLGFTINSKFDPTSIEDYSKMFKSYIDTYKDYEERYQTLIDNASLLEKLNANENDTEAYKRYKEYLNGVEELANNLATNGWDRNKDIAGAMKAKKDYMQIIKPIEEAYNTREKLAEEQRKLLAQNPTMMFDTDMANISIDSLIGKPGTYKSYSGALLTSQVAEAAKNLAREVKENPRKWRSILGNQYYETMMQSGYTSDQILAAMTGVPGAATELTKIINDVLDSSDIASWGNADVMQRARDYAAQGLWNAIGSIKYDTLGNMGYERKPNGKSTETESMLAINPVNIYSAKRVKEDRVKNKNINNYFTKDSTTGKITFNRDKYSKNQELYDDAIKHTDFNGSDYYYNGSDYYNNIVIDYNKEINNTLQQYLPEGVTVKTATDEQLVSAYEQYVKDYEAIQNNSYDAHKETAYQFNIASSNQKDFKNALMTGIKSTGKLRGVDYNPDTYEIEVTGDDLSSVDLNDDKTQVTSLEMSPYGIIVNINVKGEVKQYQLPASMNGRDQEGTLKQLQAATDINKMITDGYFIDENTGEKKYLTEQQKADMYIFYQAYIDAAHRLAANIGFVNDTQPQKFSAIGH